MPQLTTRCIGYELGRGKHFIYTNYDIIVRQDFYVELQAMFEADPKLRFIDNFREDLVVPSKTASCPQSLYITQVMTGSQSVDCELVHLGHLCLATTGRAPWTRLLRDASAVGALPSPGRLHDGHGLLVRAGSTQPPA